MAVAIGSSQNLPIQSIGPDDLLAVSVYNSPEFTRSVRVAADGFVALPILKQRVRAAGLMPASVEAGIATALREERLLVDPFVTVTVAEYHSRPIAVMGAVKRPLTFQAERSVTLLDALARAEGLSPEAGPEILVTGGARIRRIAVHRLLDGSDPALNVRLTGGESVRVPEAGRVYVLGNVKRPGAYPALSSPDASVLKAIAMAEGLLPLAAKRAYVYRRGAAGVREDIAVDLGKIVGRKAPDVPLLADDILYVPDAKGPRIGLATLEKALLFGGGAMSALVYAGVR